MGYKRLSKNHRAVSSWDLCPYIMATESKICISSPSVSTFLHHPISHHYQRLSHLLGSCLRFLTRLSRRPESCGAAGAAPSEGTAPCTPQVPWFQFGLCRDTCRSCAERDRDKGTAGVAVSQQEQVRCLDRASSPPACSRQGCSFFHTALACGSCSFEPLVVLCLLSSLMREEFLRPKNILSV